MPIFDYLCEDCNNSFEVIQKREDEPPECPKCTSNNVNKEILASKVRNFRFNASGYSWVDKKI